MTRITALLGVALLLTTTGLTQAAHPRSGISIGIGGGGIGIGYSSGYGGYHYGGYPYYGGYYHGGYPYYGGYYHGGYYPYSSGVSVGIGVVPRLAPIYVEQPTYVAPAEEVAAPENVAETVKPVKKATIKIINPSTNTQTLGYALDGKHVFHLKPGESQELDQEYEITFDRSGGAGVARYTLSTGTYKFTPKEDGSWELFNVD